MKIRIVLLCVVVLCAQAAWVGPTPAAVLSLPPYIPAEYQDAVSKVLPGYEILRNEDFIQDETQLKKFISPDEIAARKKREALGFIVGRFNDDSFPDFAAWVINRSIKQEQPAGVPKSEKFAVRLVVCLGTSTPREYRCEILPTIFGDFASLPFWADLGADKIGGEMLWCGDDKQNETIVTFYPEGWKGKRSDEIPARKLHPNYDSIGESLIGTNAVRVLVRRPEGGYLDCSGGD